MHNDFKRSWNYLLCLLSFVDYTGCTECWLPPAVGNRRGQTQADLGKAVPEGWRILWFIIHGQSIQVQVLAGRAPVRLLQFGKRPVFKWDGISVCTGPHRHRSGSTEVSLVWKRAGVVFLSTAEEAAASLGAVLFLQLSVKMETISLPFQCDNFTKPIPSTLC